MFKKIKNIFTLYSIKNILSGKVVIKLNNREDKANFKNFCYTHNIFNYDNKGVDISVFDCNIIKHNPHTNRLGIISISYDTCKIKNLKVYNWRKIKTSKKLFKDFSFLVLNNNKKFIKSQVDILRDMVIDGKCDEWCVNCTFYCNKVKKEINPYELCENNIKNAKSILKNFGG